MANFLDMLFGGRKPPQKAETKHPISDPTDASQIEILHTPEEFIEPGKRLLQKQIAEQKKEKSEQQGGD